MTRRLHLLWRRPRRDIKFRSAAVVAALTLVASGFAASAPAAADDTTLPYQDTSLPFDVRAADLVSRMTFEEKLTQFFANSSRPANMAIPRLGVPAYRYWNEALHGVADTGATSFPSALGIGSTWDRDLVNQMATVISDEARAYANAGRHDLTYWSPTINLARDPRWGRADESYGEDPYLTGQIGSQFVEGLQGDDPTYTKIVSTPKHFFANNAENYRRNGDSEVTERELREYYTPAFAALTGQDGAASGSLMTAYNEVNGTPVSTSKEYVEDLARRTWGFDGFVVTDCSAIRDVFDRHVWTPEGWDRPVNVTEASAYGLTSGADLDCQDNYYSQVLDDARDQGLVSEADLDVALVRIFTERMRLGEFDPAASVPWRSSQYTTAVQLGNANHTAVADQMSNEAPVLLKNEAPIGSATPALPLKAAQADNVVLLGYLGREANLGGYSGTPQPAPRTPQQGLDAAIQQFAPGAHVTQIDGIGPVTQGLKPGVLGVTFADAEGGQTFATDPPPSVRNDVWDWLGWQGIQYDPVANYPTAMMPNADWGGMFSINAVIPAGTTQVLVRQTGNTTPAGGANSVVPGGSFVVHEGAETGPVVATVPAEGAASSNASVPYSGATGSEVKLFFVYQPPTYSVTLTPQQQDQIRNAKAVVVRVGTRNNESAEEMDRYSIDLPRSQDQLVRAAAELNPKTVVWVQSVGQMNIESFRTPWRYDDDDDPATPAKTAKVPSIVWSNYDGQQQGEAFARILFGQANPSGKLTYTWYSNMAQLAGINDYTLTPTGGRDGRTYQYFTGDVSYPFGYGLSYSSFRYSDATVDRKKIGGDDTLKVSVKVTNTSNVAGNETVELYVSSPRADGVNRPTTQLKGFEKVSLDPGQTKTVTIPVKASDLWFWDDQADRKTWDLGIWQFHIGPSSTSGSTGSFTLTSAPRPQLGVVATVPDGVVLNTATPDNVVHAELSATRDDDSFYDLSKVGVVYRSSDPSVATVDADGTVHPAGAGVAQITATVTADGSSKSDTFPVTVYNGQYTAGDVTLFAHQVQLADRGVGLDQAKAGVRMTASTVPAAENAAYMYRMALNEENTAGATITPDGVLTATRAGTAKVTVVADIGGAKYAHTATITVGSAGDGAHAAPGVGALSSDEGWDTGLSDGNFNVTMNLWWGENASTFTLFQDGVAVGTTRLTPHTPNAQTASIQINGLSNGTYRFTGELSNSHGTTATQPVTVVVRNAAPGLPELSHDNWDGDGSYTLTANLWWGTNATSYRFLENGTEVATGTLTAHSPEAQQATARVTGKAPGTYAYTVEFTNSAGTTTSAPLNVHVQR